MVNLDNRFISPGKTIGIIGGGQLGRMMALAAKEAGYKIAVLDPTPNSPCGQVADIELTAAYDDKQALLQLAQNSDVITFEFENIDYDALQWLTEIAYVPQGAEIIRITQDRILEKNALEHSGVKVAPYWVIETVEDLENGAEQLGFPCVLKTARGGYDGKGQYVLQNKEDIHEASALLEHGNCVLESWIPFEKEVSVIVTRSVSGELKCFPIGENIHVNNILHETIVPARTTDEVMKNAYTLAEKIAGHLNLVGTLAVEMFLTRDGELFVNELAPRPHNSGHYSIEACAISQFAQHVRAICNWPLREPQLLSPVIMVNILGQHVDKVLEQIPQNPKWSIHLYGKEAPKYQRKMGHVTVLTDDVENALVELEQSTIWN